MADTGTPRLKTYFNDSATGVLKDNIAGDIEPVDLQDMIASLEALYGEIYVSTPAATSLDSDDGFKKMLGTTTLGTCNGFDDGGAVSNRLKYIGSVTRKFLVTAVCTCIVASTSVTYSLKLYKNSLTSIDSSLTQINVAGAADIHTYVVQAIVELATDDYIEIWGNSNSAAASNATLQTANMVAVALFG